MRRLCGSCLHSFSDAGASGPGDPPLCPDCRDLAARAAGRRTGRPGAPASTEPLDPGPIREAPAPSAGRLRRAIEERCAGRIWQWRAPFLVLLAWIFVRHLAGGTYASIFAGLNLGIHELGHLVFAPLGQFLGVAGGTILQCSAPVIAIGLFWRQKDLFAMTVGLGWLSTNLFAVAVYAGDARSMSLPLVTPGGGPAVHDWNYMLGRLGILRWDGIIAATFRGAGIVAMLAAIAGGAWIIAAMIRLRRRRGPA